MNRASSSMATVSVDGMAAITLTRDSYGLTIRNQLSGDTHVAFNLSGAGVTPLTVYSANGSRCPGCWPGPGAGTSTRPS